MPQTTPVAQRLFLALWPDDGVRAQIESVGRQLRLDGGRLIAPQNLHATLIFLGMRNAVQRACIEQAAPGGAAFEFVLDRLESRQRSGIAWLTTSEVPVELRDLMRALNAALAPCDYTPETRPYRLHVTLVRGARRIRGEPPFVPIVWRACEFCLVSSRPGPSGSAYAVERRWPLA